MAFLGHGRSFPAPKLTGTSSYTVAQLINPRSRAGAYTDIGLIADPGLCTGGTKRDVLQAFLEELLDSYIEVFGSERNAMFRMKENWHMLLWKFEDSEKLGKRLRKTTDAREFRAITREIFETLPMRENVVYDP